MPGRRTVISSAGALMTGAWLMSGLATSSHTRHSLTLEVYDSGKVDYKVVITGTDGKKESDTEDGDSVNVDYDHNLTFIRGTVENDKDVYSFPADEHITYIRLDAKAYTRDMKLRTDAGSDNVNDWNLIEVQGYDDSIYYTIEPTDDIREYSKTEWDDNVDNGRARGRVEDGGEDQYEMDGNFAYVDADLEHGTLVIDWTKKD